MNEYSLCTCPAHLPSPTHLPCPVLCYPFLFFQCCTIHFPLPYKHHNAMDVEMRGIPLVHLLFLGLLEKLCTILMASGVPADVLTETINCVSEVIRGNQSNQEYFASVLAPSNPPR